MLDNMDRIKNFPSPNGRFLLELHAIEMRMSHTVDSPYLLGTQTNKGLFSAGSLWDAYDVLWSDDSQKLSMSARHYSNGMHQFFLSLDLENETAVLLFEERELLSGSIDSVEKSMKELDRVSSLLKAK